MSRRTEALAEEAGRVARPIAESMGLEVVDVVFHEQRKRGFLRLDVDRPGPAGVSLADCEALSRAVEAALDVAGFMEEPAGGYTLEVSSPGIDRPIRSDDDVRRNAGRWVHVETSVAIRGSHTTSGELLGHDGGNLRLRLVGGEEILIPRASILIAKQALLPEGRHPSGGRPA